MPACLFDSCCGCIELRTGCLIIGYIQLVVEIILMAIGLLLLLGGGVAAAAGKDEDTQAIGGAALIFGVLVLLIVFLLFAFTIVLLVGVHQNKRGHVKAYLIYSYIFLVLGIIGFFAGFAGQIDPVQVIRDLILILLNIYFTLMIRSHHHKMDDKRPQIYNTA